MIVYFYMRILFNKIVYIISFVRNRPIPQRFCKKITAPLHFEYTYKTSNKS